MELSPNFNFGNNLFIYIIFRNIFAKYVYYLEMTDTEKIKPHLKKSGTV